MKPITSQNPPKVPMGVLTLKTPAALPLRQLRLCMPLRTVNLSILATIKNTKACHVWIGGDQAETPHPPCTTCTLPSASREPLCSLQRMPKNHSLSQKFQPLSVSCWDAVLYITKKEKKALKKPCQLLFFHNQGDNLHRDDTDPYRKLQEICLQNCRSLVCG